MMSAEESGHAAHLRGVDISRLIITEQHGDDPFVPNLVPRMLQL